MDDRSSSSTNEGRGGTVFKALGAGCGGLGCLLMVAAIVLLGMVAAGAFNYTAESQALAGGGTTLCCGISSLLLGILLIVVGRSR